MPQSAAENFALALERVGNPNLSDDEHQVAVEELLTSHAKLLRKQGVETAPRRTVGQLISFALLLAVVVSMVLNISFSVTAHETANTARTTANVAKKTVTELRELQHGLLLNQRQGCERSNEKQASQVKNLEEDKANALSEVRVLEDEAADPAREARIAELHKYAREKQGTINEQVAAVAEVAKELGSAETNCKKAYPLNQPAALVLGAHGAPAASSGGSALGLLDLALLSR